MAFRERYDNIALHQYFLFFSHLFFFYAYRDSCYLGITRRVVFQARQRG